MTSGTLYGIGVGPGDPEWITVKAAGILAACRCIYAPRSAAAAESVALGIARRWLRPDATVHELDFPMTAGASALDEGWQAAARQVRETLLAGEDCCFLTLGDPLLYSTYVYLLRQLRALEPPLRIVTVPGITAASAAAALTNFPLGQGKELVTIVPAADDLGQFRAALQRGGTVVLLKIGRRLQKVLDELDRLGLTDRAVLVSHAGMEQQRIETELGRLRAAPDEMGYLSVLLVHAKPPAEEP
jgi:precorrin-2/cobalt-factor-2 C20-methyltransferase